jgi:hypothetical protein
MASLLQHKNASIKRLKRLIFRPSSGKRAVTGSSTEMEAADPDEESEPQPAFDLRSQFANDVHTTHWAAVGIIF